MIHWKGAKSPTAPASYSEAPLPSTSLLVVEGEHPLLEPKENIAPTPSLELKATESPPSPPSSSDDPPPFGRSTKDNVYCPSPQLAAQLQ